MRIDIRLHRNNIVIVWCLGDGKCISLDKAQEFYAVIIEFIDYK